MPFNPKVTNVKKRLQRKSKHKQEFRYESDFGKWFYGFVQHFCDDLTFFHVANERKTSGKAGAGLKAQGVTPGVADYLWLKYKAAIELKLPGKKTTPSQNAFLDAAEGIGWKTYVLTSKWQCYICISELTRIPLARLEQYDALKQIKKYTGHKPHTTELTKGK